MLRFHELVLGAVIGLTSLACFADASAGSADGEDSALGNHASREYFSVPAFFITFRETIEVGFGCPCSRHFSRWGGVGMQVCGVQQQQQQQ